MAATTAMILAGIAAAASISSGIEAKKEGSRQAKYASLQAEQQAAESARVAQRESTMASQEAESTRRAQKLAYLKSGVTLEGSPLLVMEGTRAQGQDNVNEIMQAGAAGVKSSYVEGRLRAQASRSAGRQAFLSSLGQAGSMGAGAF